MQEEIINATVETAESEPKKAPIQPILPKDPKLKTIDKIFIISMLIIPIVHFCIFFIYVNLNSILMAFQIYTPEGAEWSLESFKAVFRSIANGNAAMNEITLFDSLRNTLIYFVKDLIMLPFHVLIAYFLFRRIKGYKTFQIIFYLPSIVSGVAIATMFQFFIKYDGPVGVILQKLGMSPLEIPHFLANSDYATWTILFYTLWLGWGGQMLLLGGALARIPIEILESARLDGIGTWQEILYMIIPLIWPTMSTLLILQMTGIFSASGPILLFTNGNYKTSTIGFWIYSKIKYTGVSAYNEVAAAGLLFTCIGVPLILGVRKLIESVPTAEY